MKMLEIHNNLLRYLLIGISVFIVAVFAMPATIRIINIGNIVGMLVGIILFVFSVWNQPISKTLHSISEHKIGHIALSVFGLLLICGMTVCLMLSIMMTTSMKRKPTEQPQAVIVLGCKVRDGIPSRMLRKRLEAAYEAMQDYPEMICVVSGGKGDDESISEAQCMYEWLTSKGIPAERILQEKHSTSTSENFSFSKQLLSESGISDDIMIATDGYHQMRAQILAKKEEFSHVSAASANTQLGLLPTYWVREWFGIAHAVVFGD